MNFKLVCFVLFCFHLRSKNKSVGMLSLGNMRFKCDIFLKIWKIPFCSDSTYFFIGLVLIKPISAFELKFNQQSISMLQCKD